MLTSFWLGSFWAYRVGEGPKSIHTGPAQAGTRGALYRPPNRGYSSLQNRAPTGPHET